MAKIVIDPSKTKSLGSLRIIPSYQPVNQVELSPEDIHRLDLQSTSPSMFLVPRIVSSDVDITISDQVTPMKILGGFTNHKQTTFILFLRKKSSTYYSRSSFVALKIKRANLANRKPDRASRTLGNRLFGMISANGKVFTPIEFKFANSRYLPVDIKDLKSFYGKCFIAPEH